MPSYSFKERFVPMVKDGSKRQTVRALRKNNPVPGQLAHLFYGLRTSNCKKLLLPQFILQVKTVFITSPVDMVTPGNIFLFPEMLSNYAIQTFIDKGIDELLKKNCAEYKLTDPERELFAWKDGFRHDGSTEKNPKGSYELMYRWWMQNNELPFVGTVTYW